MYGIKPEFEIILPSSHSTPHPSPDSARTHQFSYEGKGIAEMIGILNQLGILDLMRKNAHCLLQLSIHSPTKNTETPTVISRYIVPQRKVDTQWEVAGQTTSEHTPIVRPGELDTFIAMAEFMSQQVATGQTSFAFSLIPIKIN